MNTITIVIPTLNEESGIRETISSIPMAILKKNYDVEILVVDGKSKDRTIEIAKEAGAKVIIEERKGYGRAYKTGFNRAKGEIIITMDADATYPAERIPEYLLLLEQNNIDFLTINRFDSMDKDAMNTLHKLGNFALTKLLRLLYSVNIRDSQSGMWIMKKSFAKQISIASDGMPFSQDIKIVAFKYFKAMEAGGSYFKRLGEAKMNLIHDGLPLFKNLFVFKSQLSHCLEKLPLEPLHMIGK